ncbi:unnamed protein product [Mytilus edulis]|uniref:Reverse transcriptase domain-containing protein n=1 Tax=Mytilus edulis TaxID=6550 RepID=A0A8S3TK82_MYTED|nr:unnamed protein product [Mytilus edulis]
MCIQNEHLDIIGIAETHLTGKNEIRINGYKWFGHNRTELHERAKKGSGGVGFLVRDDIASRYNIEILDKSVEGILWVHVQQSDGRDCFRACVCYLPPTGTTRNIDANDFYDSLLSQVHVYGNESIFFLCGDFNSRCGDMDDYIAGVDTIPERNVVDFKRNAHGELLCEYLINSNCCILNGRKGVKNNYTYISQLGSSVVDYCLIPYELLDIFEQCDVITMSELIEKHDIFEYVDPLVSKPDHSMLLWNVKVEKCVSEASNDNGNKSEYNKFNLKNIPNSFLADHLRDIEELILSLELNNVNQNNLDIVYQNFVNLLKNEMLEKMDYKVIKVSLGLNNKKRRMKKPWWSDHLTILWNDVCAIEKEMLKSKSDTRKRQCRQEFICKRKLFDRETQRSKRRYWRDQLNEIDNLESTNQTEFWKKIGRVGVGEERRKAIPMSVQLPDGSISHDRDAVLNEWKRSFCSLLNPEGSIDNLPTDTSTDNGATMNYDITHEEVKRAVISLKVNKAVGVDEIPSEVLKNPRLLNFLLSLFNKCFFSGTIPTIWRKGIINPIPKSSTSNPKDPMCYRGLTLVPVCYKLYCHILNNRLLEWEEENNILDDCQNGFRKGRSTIDHIKSLSSIIETRKLKRLSTFTAFIDFRKAYDGIDRNLLCQKLLDIGICGNMYNAIVSLYKSVECCVRVNGQLTDWFNVQCGLKQGCLLSPLLFNVYVNGLVTYICSLNVGINIDEENVSILLYADDLVLLAGSESDLQVLLDGLQLWCAENKMTINHNKSNVVHFRPNSTPRTINSFKCGELDINVVGKYTYLGLVLTEHLDYQIMAKHVAASANRALGLVISKYKSFGGLPFDSFTKLYDSIVWSTISYGAAVWGDRTFSCINSIQNKAIRFYMGVGRYTPNVAVNGDSAWKPPCVRQWRTVINQWNRLRYMNTDRLNKRIHNWAEHSFRRYKACKNSNYRLYQQFESCNISDWYNDTNIHKTTVLAKIEDKLLTDFRNKWTEDLHRVSARRMDGDC